MAHRDTSALKRKFTALVIGARRGVGRERSRVRGRSIALATCGRVHLLGQVSQPLGELVDLHREVSVLFEQIGLVLRELVPEGDEVLPLSAPTDDIAGPDDRRDGARDQPGLLQELASHRIGRSSPASTLPPGKAQVPAPSGASPTHPQQHPARTDDDGADADERASRGLGLRASDDRSCGAGAIEQPPTAGVSSRRSPAAIDGPCASFESRVGIDGHGVLEGAEQREVGTRAPAPMPIGRRIPG